MTYAQYVLLVDAHNAHHDPKSGSGKRAPEQGSIADLLMLKSMKVG